MFLKTLYNQGYSLSKTRVSTEATLVVTFQLIYIFVTKREVIKQ